MTDYTKPEQYIIWFYITTKHHDISNISSYFKKLLYLNCLIIIYLICFVIHFFGVLLFLPCALIQTQDYKRLPWNNLYYCPFSKTPKKCRGKWDYPNLSFLPGCCLDRAARKHEKNYYGTCASLISLENTLSHHANVALGSEQR